MDYISRDDVIKKIAEKQDKAMYGREDVAFYQAIKIIREEPSADVQPTKKVDEYRSLLEECERKLRYLLECEIENSTSVIEVKSLINKIQSSLKGSEQNV